MSPRVVRNKYLKIVKGSKGPSALVDERHAEKRTQDTGFVCGAFTPTDINTGNCTYLRDLSIRYFCSSNMIQASEGLH